MCQFVRLLTTNSANQLELINHNDYSIIVSIFLLFLSGFQWIKKARYSYSPKGYWVALWIGKRKQKTLTSYPPFFLLRPIIEDERCEKSWITLPQKLMGCVSKKSDTKKAYSINWRYVQTLESEAFYVWYNSCTKFDILYWHGFALKQRCCLCLTKCRQSSRAAH